MKVVKVYYMNDERKDIIVRVLDSHYNPANPKPGDGYSTLKPCEGREFELYIPDNSILYVKKWPSMVMLSYLEQSAQPQSAQLEKQLQPEAVE